MAGIFLFRSYHKIIDLYYIARRTRNIERQPAIIIFTHCVFFLVLGADDRLTGEIDIVLYFETMIIYI